MRRLFPSQRIRPGTKIVRCVVVEPSITPSAYKLRLGGCCSARRNVRLPTASPSLIGSLQPLSVLLLYHPCVRVNGLCPWAHFIIEQPVRVHSRRGVDMCLCLRIRAPFSARYQSPINFTSMQNSLHMSLAFASSSYHSWDKGVAHESGFIGGLTTDARWHDFLKVET